MYLGKPPFEDPTILDAMQRFLEHRYARSKDLPALAEIAKRFMAILNAVDLPTPKSYAPQFKGHEAVAYQKNYFRWQIYCRGRCGHTFKGSKHAVTQLFGRSLLCTVYEVVRAQFMSGADQG
jgi:hypothetical protein